jgi:inosose dehydratase
MTELGPAATQLGPDGFLPGLPDRLATLLAEHHLSEVGGITGSSCTARTSTASPR